MLHSVIYIYLQFYLLQLYIFSFIFIATTMGKTKLICINLTLSWHKLHKFCSLTAFSSRLNVLSFSIKIPFMLMLFLLLLLWLLLLLLLLVFGCTLFLQVFKWLLTLPVLFCIFKQQQRPHLFRHLAPYELWSVLVFVVAANLLQVKI